MTRTRSTPNRAPTVGQLLSLANRAARKVLSNAEVHTLKLGIEALAAVPQPLLVESASPVAPVVVLPEPVESQRLLGAAVGLYASAYGLTVQQAWAEIRAEAGR